MTPRNDLVPTPTVDKNGRWTTVYRRLFGLKDKQSESRIPAPSLAPVAPSFDRAASLRRLQDTALKGVEGFQYQYAVAVFKEYPDHLLRRLEEAEKNEPENFWMVSKMVSAGKNPNQVSEALFFFPLMGQVQETTAARQVRSLHSYLDHLPPSNDYSQESEETRAKCVALIEVSRRALWKLNDDEVFTDEKFNGKPLHVFKDNRLIDLILEDPERAVDIADIIEQRNSADPEMIRSLLVAESQAMRDGVL